MRVISTAIAAAALLTLGACGGGADDRAAENVEANAEAVADNVEAAADNATNDSVEDNLEDRAEQIRDAGEEKADRIDRTDNSAAETNAAR